MTEDIFRGKSLIYAHPKVLSLESTWAPTTPQDPTWDVLVHYAADPSDNFRIVTGNLRATSNDGNVSVIVGALMAESGTASPEAYRNDFLNLVRESEAVETLYAHARQQALSLAAVTGLTFELPRGFYPLTSISEVPRPSQDEETAPADDNKSVSTEEPVQSADAGNPSD